MQVTVNQLIETIYRTPYLSHIQWKHNRAGQQDSGDCAGWSRYTGWPNGRIWMKKWMSEL